MVLKIMQTFGIILMEVTVFIIEMVLEVKVWIICFEVKYWQFKR